MKKIILAWILLVATFISTYFIFIWNPDMKAQETIAINENKNFLEYEKSGDKKDSSKNINEVLKFTNKSLNEIMLNDEMEKLSSYTNKLSITDNALINEYINSKSDYNSLKELIRIFKNRFSKDEYNEIKKILGKYMYVDKIEKNI